jgi:hypothetical protein
MAINLSQAWRNSADSRNELYDAGISQYGRGFASSGMGDEANAMYENARSLYDTQPELAALYEQQAQAMQQRAMQLAPRVPKFSGIRSAGDAIDWGLGAAGMTSRTMLEPLAGSLGGAGVGAIAGSVIPGLGTAAGAGLGTFLGGTLGGLRMERNEATGEAMSDPAIRASRSMSEIGTASTLKGIGASALESLVPGIATGRLFKPFVKEAAKSAFKPGVKAMLKEAGKDLLKDAGTEALTEGAQSLTGQAAQNWLKGRSLTDFEYQQAFDEAMVGALGGAGMGAGSSLIGNRLQALKGRLYNPYGDAPENKGVAFDQRLKEAGQELAGALERGVEAGRPILKDVLERAASVTGRMANRFTGLDDAGGPDEPGGGAGAAASPETQLRRANEYADSILAEADAHDDQELAAAQEFKQTGDVARYRDQVTLLKHQRENTQDMTSLADALEDAVPESKASLIGATGEGPGQTLDALADLWLENEGPKFRAFKHPGEPRETTRAVRALMYYASLGKGGMDRVDAYTLRDTLLRTLGDEALAVFDSTLDYARKQGLAGREEGENPVRESLAQGAKRFTSDEEAITRSLTPLARPGWSRRQSRELAMALRGYQGELTRPELNATLNELFGNNTDAVLEHFYERGRTGEETRTSRETGLTRTSLEGEDTSADVLDPRAQGEEAANVNNDYDLGIEVEDEPLRTSYQGLGTNNKPYRVQYPERAAELKTELLALQNEHGMNARAVGVWQSLKEQLAGDAHGLRNAEKTHWAVMKKPVSTSKRCPTTNACPCSSRSTARTN